MTLTEKTAYIKGLVEGLELNADEKEVKVINAIIGLLDDMALTVSDLEDVLLKGGIQCPNCGESLEFDFDDLECDCGCCSDADDEDYCGCGCGEQVEEPIK